MAGRGLASRGIAAMASLTEEVTELMDELEMPLLRYCTRLVRRPELAQDIVQDAFIRYLNYRRRPDGRAIKNAKAWLYRVTHNLALDHIRRNRRGEEIQAELRESMAGDRADGPDELLARKDAAAAAWELLEMLSERDRQVVLLKVVDNRSYKEISEIMEISVSNVGFILHTSLKKLAGELTDRLA
jgi:RNA polymerase sigma-70 factor (ECF subfamily)